MCLQALLQKHLYVLVLYLLNFLAPCVTHAQSDKTSLKQRDQEALCWLCSAGSVSGAEVVGSVRVVPWPCA